MRPSLRLLFAALAAAFLLPAVAFAQASAPPIDTQALAAALAQHDTYAVVGLLLGLIPFGIRMATSEEKWPFVHSGWFVLLSGALCSAVAGVTPLLFSHASLVVCLTAAACGAFSGLFSTAKPKAAAKAAAAALFVGMGLGLSACDGPGSGLGAHAGLTFVVLVAAVGTVACVGALYRYFRANGLLALGFVGLTLGMSGCACWQKNSPDYNAPKCVVARQVVDCTISAVKGESGRGMAIVEGLISQGVFDTPTLLAALEDAGIHNGECVLESVASDFVAQQQKAGVALSATEQHYRAEFLKSWLDFKATQRAGVEYRMVAP